MKKIIKKGNCWSCANMDLLADIIDEGITYLFNDNSTITIWNSDESNNIDISSYEYATEEEVKNFTRKYRGCIYFGDTVVINRGRKMRGETKTVCGGYRYEVPGTYGHQCIDYLFFTDGTKVNMRHCDVIGIDYEEDFTYRQYIKKNQSYPIYVGGRM